MSRFQIHLTLNLVLAAVLLLPAPPSSASLYEVELRGYDGSNLFCGLAPETFSEPQPVADTHSHQVADVVGASSSEQEALAGMGYVGMKQTVSHRVNPGWGRIFGNCSTVRTVIDDLQVAGPPGQIPTSLNARLRGKIAVDTLTSRAYLKVSVTLRTQGGASVTNEVEIDISESSDLDQIINSGPINVTAGEALEAELRIDMGVIAGPVRDASAVVSVFDILDETEGYGLHFSETEVLTLPAGYTSNSVEGDVGDNMWGGTVPVTVSSWGAVKSLYR